MRRASAITLASLVVLAMLAGTATAKGPLIPGFGSPEGEPTTEPAQEPTAEPTPESTPEPAPEPGAEPAPTEPAPAQPAPAEPAPAEPAPTEPAPAEAAPSEAPAEPAPAEPAPAEPAPAASEPPAPEPKPAESAPAAEHAPAPEPERDEGGLLGDLLGPGDEAPSDEAPAQRPAAPARADAEDSLRLPEGVAAVGDDVSGIGMAIVLGIAAILLLVGASWLAARSRREKKARPARRTFDHGRQLGRLAGAIDDATAAAALRDAPVGDLVRHAPVPGGAEVVLMRRKTQPCAQAQGYLVGMYERAWADEVAVEHVACAGEKGGQCRYVLRRALSASGPREAAGPTPGSGGALRRSPPARPGGG